jgi:hypothetical protein
MASIILPYKNLGEAIEVNFDLNAIPHKKTGERSYLIDPTFKGKTVDVKITAKLPSGYLNVFPKAEQKNPPLELVATILSVDSGLRNSVTLRRAKPALYEGLVSLDFGRISELAEITIVASRTTSGSGAGFAVHAGSRVAWSPKSEVRISERPKRGNFLKIAWEEFNNSAVVPKGFDDALFYIDSEHEPVVLYLNKMTDDALIKLFETKGHGHAKALPRDVLLSTVATSAWLVLAQSALGALHAAASKGTPVDLDEEFDGGWRQQVIELLAPSLLPHLTKDDAIAELCLKMDETTYYANILLTAQLVIQCHRKTRQLFERYAEKEFSNG